MAFAFVTLLTDYGLEDGFVAACHGVLARSAPGVHVIDVTHLVPPMDVRRGAAVLAQTLPYLPPAVHVGVVDPGVGTQRRAVAIAAGGSLLVGPDNGLLPDAADALGGVQRAHLLANDALWAHPVSPTFHGRDVFCPVAARLATGTGLDEVGPPVDAQTLVRLDRPYSSVTGELIEAEVVTVDHFGNLQLPALELPWPPGTRVVVESGGVSSAAQCTRTFGDGVAGSLVVFVDSAGRLAVAVNGGRAADVLRAAPGDRLGIRKEQ